MNDFIEIIKHMESIDKLSNENIISDESLIEIIKNSALYSSSLLKKNTSNIVVLLDKRHTQFWREIVLKQIKEENFAQAYGTILFFEDVSKQMKIDEKCINKRLNIQKYSNAMLQFCVWCALEIEGLGANIQYYNVEIDKQKLDIPQQWNLVAQMPFGKIKEMPKSKKIKENIKIEVLK